MPEPAAQTRLLSPAVFLAALVTAALSGLFATVGQPTIAFLAVLSAGFELVQGLAIVLSAAGWGHLVIRRLLPASAPRAVRVLTACATGLWLLSTAVMIAGSLVKGVLTPYVWWPVIAGGTALAIWQAWPTLRGWKFTRRIDAASLVWVLPAVAVGIWLAGAMQPVGFIGTVQGDAYDVLEYHLQLPRLYFESGQIQPLHNCFSCYPLGTEMLYLLAMCLRDGAYSGMYLATLLHGLQGVLAVGAIYVAMKPAGKPGAMFAALLLATAPGLIYLGWLAKTELAQVMYLALAMAWMRHWMEEGSWRSALAVGLMIGSACATKYVAIGIVALPALAVMAALCVGRWRRAWHVALAGGASLLLMSPWLVRNAVTVGNPVFPLAAKALGKGYWADQQVQRWANGTGPTKMPPVPAPPGWTMPAVPGTLETVAGRLLIEPFLSPPLVVLAALAVIAAIAVRRSRWRLALAGVLAVQCVMWWQSHEFPWRFLMPASVTMAMLAGDLLAGIGQRLSSSTCDGKARASGWALPIFIVVACSAWGLFATIGIFQADTPAGPMAAWDGQDIARQSRSYAPAAQLPSGSRIMLVGDAKLFYFPSGTVATTAFDPHPLEEWIDQGLSSPEILRRLKAMGVTHLWFNWIEIRRLANSYGFPASLSVQACQNMRAGLRPTLPILTSLENLGAKPTNLDELGITVYTLP